MSIYLLHIYWSSRAVAFCQETPFTQRTLERHLQALLQAMWMEKMITRSNPCSTHIVQTNCANIVPSLNLSLISRLERSKSASLQIQNSHVVKNQILQPQIHCKIRRANGKNTVGSELYQIPAHGNTCSQYVDV